MKRTAISLLLGCIVSSVGCGAGPTPPPEGVAVPAASTGPASPGASAAATPARRSPPDDVLRYWAFDGHPHLVLYADVGGLLRTELGRAIVPAALMLAKGTLSQDQAQCIRGAADSVKDLAFGGDDDGGLVIARFDDAAFNPSPCLSAAGAKPKAMEGAKEAFATSDTVIVHQPGLLLMGPEKNVVQALKPRSGPSTFPSSVSLGTDEYMAWTLRADEGIQGSGTLLASSDRFRIGMEGDLPAPLAAHIEREWQTRKGETAQLGLSGDEAAMVKKLFEAIELKRDGGHLAAAFDLREPAVDQARDLGMVASLATFAVRKYLADAKSAEARNSIGQIAKDYAAWYEKEDGTPRAKKKLVSFPAVPKAVPQGTKYQSTPADWKPWGALRFSMDMPQYYQYEVRAAKDGNSADIFARGDLDGNGKQSQFRLHLAIDRKKDVMVIDPSIEERDPNE